MLEWLELENFQCHEKVVLDFVPGVNVIAGTSDVGKSAILKGLLWLITNKPQGLGFRRAQAKKGDAVSCKIRIDGHEIARSRSESVNEYMLDGQKFVAMKSDVPTDISQVLNIAPVNIQTQFVPHYLLSASSAEVARTLNESCDLAVIDTTMKRIKSIEQDAKSREKALAAGEAEIEDDLASLQWVDDAKLLKNEIQIKLEYRDAAKREMVALENITLPLAQVEKNLACQEQMGKPLAVVSETLLPLVSKWQEMAKKQGVVWLSDA